MKQIASVLNGSKVAYEVSDDWNWNGRGSAPLSVSLNQYQTYGDGVVKHSNAWCAQWADMTDACLSLTSAILADPQATEWKQVPRMFATLSPDVLAFVQTIKHRDDRRQWFNFSERKVSTAESKQHDKRWTSVESWMDGTAPACLSILLNQFSHHDWFARLAIADDLRTAMGYPMWEEFFKPTSELTGDWHQAFRALRAASESVAQLDNARRVLECALENSKPQAQPEAVAA